MSDDPNYSKAQLETLIVGLSMFCFSHSLTIIALQSEYGGRFVQNPRAADVFSMRTHSTTIISGRQTFKVKLHHENYDVIHYQWLLDSIAAHKEVPFWAKKCVSFICSCSK